MKENQETQRGSLKPEGWFSRKHETDEANNEAREKYLSGHGPEIRRRKAEERRIACELRAPEEHLALLDKRLGPGQGAEKERARMEALIEDAKTSIVP